MRPGSSDAFLDASLAPRRIARQRSGPAETASHDRASAIYAASMPIVVPQDLADARSRALADALRTRVVVADGAMGTMIQEQDPSLEDYQGLEGCNEILNVSRPDIIAAVHDAYLEVGVDAIETNTF